MGQPLGDTVSGRRATAEDLASIVALRDTIAARLVARGIRQWRPGEVERADLLGPVERGELHIWCDKTKELIAVVRLTWSDPDVWPDSESADAGYVHLLMTARTGTGLGARVLDWAEEQIRLRGCERSRLDCVADNSRLIAWYAARGYVPCGVTEFHDRSWRPVLRQEKLLMT